MKRKREFEPFFSNKKLKLDNNLNNYNKKRKYESDENDQNSFNNKKVCLYDLSSRNDKSENYTRYRRDILIYT